MMAALPAGAREAGAYTGRRMNEGFAWWLLIAGIGIGVALSWLIMGRLRRADDDVDDLERVEEAAWISRSIGAYGGVAPPALVEEILELHRHYLEGPGLERSDDLVPEVDDEEDPDVEVPPTLKANGIRPKRASGES
jgi:hypothetical protein